jgi:hypothetical protein
LEERLQALDIGRAVSDFILNFERSFEHAPMPERKLLVRKCISKVIVDRDRRVAEFYVRKIPLVNSTIDGLFSSERDVMSLHCARNRVHI